jgi:single-stranded-DNA-specific exonuclease
MVPLTGVNRILAWHGLEELRFARRPGLRALMEVSNVKPGRMSSSDVGFRLGPRINAAGRLDDASAGTRLLLAKTIEEARPHAATLDVANRQRQKIEMEVFEAAVTKVDAEPKLPPAIVLYDETWHPGVVGICCSKLVERYARPVILIGEGGRGSARTAGAFHLYDAIQRVSHHLRKFGGHRAAAGMTIDAEAFPAFKKDFLEEARREEASILGADVLVYDESLLPGDIDDAFAEALERLAPFGNGNPEPLFMVPEISVKTTRVVGKGHLKLRFREGPKGGLEGIAFSKADLAPGLEGRRVQLAVHVEKSEWNGNEYLGMRVRDLRVLEP